MSSIEDFYADQTVLLTGATGFLGKLLIEKLIRSCPRVAKIYILVRPKHNVSLQDRLKEIVENSCFDTLRTLNPAFPSKLHVLNGDCVQPVLGLNSSDVDLIKKEVTCVIHAAANVRFDASLRTAICTNVRSVRDLLDIAKEMGKLKSFVYVSTAFSHCVRKNIDEEFYEVDAEPEKLLAMVEVMDDDLMEVLSPRILGKWPNTYVYTKAVSEKLIRNFKQTLPIAIVRPAIVVSTFEEPMAGWIDGFHGVVGVVTGVSLGVIRSLPLDPKATGFLVPADYVVCSILAVAWNLERTKPGNIPIYNFTGSSDNMMDWGTIIESFKSYAFVYPLSASVWYHFLQTSPNMTLHKIRAFFLHTLFAYFVDAILMVVGKGTLAVEKYRKIDKLIDLLAYFTMHDWNFGTKNLDSLWETLDESDKKKFMFSMKDFNWPKAIETGVIGGRVYLMKDPIDTIPKAKRKMYCLFVAHYLFVAIMVYYMCYWFLWPIFRAFF